MRKKISKRKQELPLTTKNIIGILFASLFGVLTTVFLTIVTSLVLKNSAVLTESISIIFLILTMIGAIITGFIASKKSSFKGIISGLISSLPYLLIVTIIMLFFSHWKLDAKVFFLFIGVLICSVIGGILSANTKRRK